MKQIPVLRIRRTVLLLLALVATGSARAAQPSVDFTREVRPILADNCFACHGFDAAQRKADLRLDTRERATARSGSGKFAIVPGKPNDSELWRRVKSRSMPPQSAGKQLTDAQIETLRRWIEQGAKYDLHWAYVAPQRPARPAVRDRSWARTAIDRFILARLEREGLRPSPLADRYTLMRRLSLDLTGLPPTLAEADDLVNDRSSAAYEKVVDRLLKSPHYGERMALPWLDMARYADTHGYHIDSHRDMWKWRDWVIGAFNRNLPYDRFTIEQLAGDLLPNPTREQKIATGFNRNHPINYEGGAIPEEYQVAYIADRIDTTATAWMGLTLRCAQCHDHKYDPFTMKDYYRFYAFFHNVPEQGLDGRTGNAAPLLKAADDAQQQQLSAFAKRVAELEQEIEARMTDCAPRVAEWEKDALASLAQVGGISGVAAHFELDEQQGNKVKDSAGKLAAGTVRGKPEFAEGKLGGALKFDGNSYVDLPANALDFERSDRFSYGAWVYPTGGEAMTVISKMDDADHFRGWDLYLGGGSVYVHLIHYWETNALRVNTKSPIPLNQWTHVFVSYDGSSKASGVRVFVNGKGAELMVTHDSLTETIKTAKPAQIGRRNPSAVFKGMIDDVRVYGRELTGVEVAQLSGREAIRKILVTAPDQRTDDQRATLTKFYLENFDESYRATSASLTEARFKRGELEKNIPTTMVMQELEKPRDTFMLVRGQYNKKGDKVEQAGTPAFFPPMPAEAPRNRLGLAQWLASPEHPLTARVAVNNIWQTLFGTGLVRTSENFGTQGEKPSHPELLDWLATELVRSGWDVKGLVKLIVTSNTYKQSSRVTPELLARDPENRLLARAPRLRLTGEFVRDQALALSGLLVPKLGGPSVRPYHPAGLWEEMAYGGGFTAQSYVQDHGEALYRRSMYTFWKRTVPPASLQAFDAPEREFCIVRRSTTNTPLQALVLMNDPTYVEASRKFAERIMTSAAATSDRATLALRSVLARPPKSGELQLLTQVFEQSLARFRKDSAAASKLLAVGESQRDQKLDPAELAAWTTVATVLFNLDEAITRG